jgi:hypothetical protein
MVACIQWRMRRWQLTLVIFKVIHEGKCVNRLNVIALYYDNSDNDLCDNVSLVITLSLVIMLSLIT